MDSCFLKTERLGFAHWSEQDISLATTLWGQPEVTRYICASGVFTQQEIQNRLITEVDNLQKRGVQYFPVFLLSNGDLVGCCGLRPYQGKPNVYEMGIHLRKEYWHQGYAQEAAYSMIDYAFSILGAAELKAGHNPPNIASRKLLLRLGFLPEGEEFYPPTGLMHPLYSMTRKDE